MSGRVQRLSGGISPNLTPMVDVVFLLIVFFIVVAQITSNERLKLTPPAIADAQTVDPGEERRVIINIVPENQIAEIGGDFLLAGELFRDDDAGRADLTDRLAVIRARNDRIAVSVRADRTERYDRAHHALRACAHAGVMRVNLIAEPIEGLR